MIKQHCDICDSVIPNTEAYRTVNFGRGTNTSIDIGYKPMVICKHCWKKMYDFIKPDNNDKDIRFQKSGALENIIGDLVFEKRCKDCKYGDEINCEACDSCKAYDKWEAKDNGEM